MKKFGIYRLYNAFGNIKVLKKTDSSSFNIESKAEELDDTITSVVNKIKASTRKEGSQNDLLTNFITDNKNSPNAKKFTDTPQSSDNFVQTDNDRISRLMQFNGVKK